MQFRTLFHALRPSFLVLSPVCVFLGASTAYASSAAIDEMILLLVVIGALCAHISVNTLNEYADFRSGLDLVTIKTPFSGGSGALPADPAMAHMVLATGLVTLFITFAIGLYFVHMHGVLLLAAGCIGVAIILTYSRWINRWPFLCLIAPGLGFGIMVAGTHYVLSQQYSVTSSLAALIVFFLVNNLLLLNQYPDIEADKSIGRNHLPIAYGTRFSSLVYGTLSLCAYLVILAGIYFDYFPALSLVAVVPAIFATFSLTGALKYGNTIGDYHQYLGANVTATILTPLLLGISIIVGQP